MRNQLINNTDDLLYEEYSARDFFSNRGITNIHFTIIQPLMENEMIPLIEVNGIMLSKGQIVNFHIWPCFHIKQSKAYFFNHDREIFDCIIRIYKKEVSEDDYMVSLPRWTCIEGIDYTASDYGEEWLPVYLETPDYKGAINPS